MKINNIFMILCLFFLVLCSFEPSCQAEVEPASDISTAFSFLLDFPSKIDGLYDLMVLFSEIPENQILKGPPWNSVTSEHNPLPNPHPIVSSKIPNGADEAIHDFRKSIAKDFIKSVGSSDGLMTRGQFHTLVSNGRLPLTDDSDSYFQTHDKDGDGKLTLGEFVPSASEIAKKNDLTIITQAFMNGIPYPTGNFPTERPIAAPPGPLPGSETQELPPKPPLFLSKEQVADRLTDFANQNGFSTHLSDKGLIVIDKEGNPVEIPPGVLPLPIEIAGEKLTDFAKKIGGSLEKGPEGFPNLKDETGKDIPPEDWPPGLRPPYMP